MEPQPQLCKGLRLIVPRDIRTAEITCIFGRDIDSVRFAAGRETVSGGKKVIWRRAILESPFASNVEKNRLYAMACARDMLSRGEAPFASHLIYPQLFSQYTEEARQQGMAAGRVWIQAAEISVVYTDLGVTEGMIRGIAEAEAKGVLVERRLLKT